LITKETFHIAGHRIDISSAHTNGLQKILDGFSPFLTRNVVNESELPLLQILIVGVENELRGMSCENEFKLVHSFEIEEGKCICSLTKKGEKYFLSISENHNIEPNNSQNSLVSTFLEMEIGSNAMTFTFDSRKPLHPGHLKFSLWMAMAFAGIPKQTAAVHSSVIVYNNQAILFLGESGTGKSTHTALWLKHIPGSSLLNDDSPLIRVELNENMEPTPFVYGSPWSGKGRWYLNQQYPIAAIVRLEQHKINHLTRLNKLGAFGALLPSFPPAYLHDDYFEEHICNIISTVVKTIPVYRLQCLPDKSAAELVKTTIFQ
jgi:hypothetical protein